jgi:hypothetical protein
MFKHIQSHLLKYLNLWQARQNTSQLLQHNGLVCRASIDIQIRRPNTDTSITALRIYYRGLSG